MWIMLIGLMLLAVLVIFGISASQQADASVAQAQAIAEQARAQAAVAGVAEAGVWGNVIVVLAVLVIVVIVLLMIGGLLYIQVVKNLQKEKTAQRQPAAIGAGEQDPMKVLQLALMAKMMEAMGRPQIDVDQRQLIEPPPERGPFYWLE